MTILSAFFAIPPFYLLLLGVIFFLLVFEIIYLWRKRTHQTQATPLATNPMVVSEKNTSTRMKWVLLTSVFFAITGVAALGYYISTQQTQDQSKAYVVNTTAACGVEVGPGTENPTSGNTNKYSLTFPVINKRPNEKRGVKLSIGRFTCPFIDKDTCSLHNGGNFGEIDKDYKVFLGPRGDDDQHPKPNSQKTITIEVEQSLGKCGTFQIDVNILAVCKDDECDKSPINWNETCKTEDKDRPGIGALLKTENACGVAPSATPTLPGATNTPTATPPVQPSPTLTLPVDSPTPTPTLTAAMCQNIQFYTVDLAASPPNLFAKRLSLAELKDLKPGDKINITAIGNTNSDKGRFRVNGSSWQELLQRNTPTNNNEFYDSNPNDLYQIPTSGTTTFTVEGQVHDASGWH